MENQIEIINLNDLKRPKGRGFDLSDNEIRVSIRINKYYHLSFSKSITKKIHESSKTCVNLAVNKLTNEIFFVFSENDGLKLNKNYHSSKKFDYVIQSKPVVFEIMSKFGIKKFDNDKINSYSLLMSDNLSNNPNYDTYKITYNGTPKNF